MSTDVEASNGPPGQGLQSSDNRNSESVQAVNHGSSRGSISPSRGGTKHSQLESEVRELREALSAMMAKQAERDAEHGEPFGMSDEHRFALQHRRYHADSSGSEDDDYTQFDQQRRRMERVFVRELKMLNREREMIKDIRSLKRDRDGLLEKEKEWERERLELQRAQKRLEQSKTEVQEDENDGTNSGDRDAPDGEMSIVIEGSGDPIATSPQLSAIPKLHYVEWSLFKALRSDAEENSYAIDVLKGEPVVTFDWTSYWGGRRAKRGGGKSDEAAKGKAAANLKKKQLGQAALPERIRIHSKEILKVFEKVSGDTFSSRDDPVIMIRPFKFLVYYDDPIRQELQRLRAKFGVQTVAIDEKATASAPPEESQEEAAKGMAAESTTKEEPGVVPAPTAEADQEAEADNRLSAIALPPLECLVEFIDTEIQQKLKYLASDSCERILFTDVWYLFKPGDEVVDQTRKQAYRVIEVASVAHKAIPPWRNWNDKSSAKADETPVKLHCVYVDFDGKNIGPVSRTFQIPRFDGEKAVTSLEVYPLRFVKSNLEKKKTFRQELIDRGKMFLDVAGVKHMHYNGLTLDARDEIDSQVVVDFEEAFASRGKGDQKPSLEELIGESQLDKEDDQMCVAECCRDENVHKDSETETKRSRDYMTTLIPEDRNREPSVTIYPRALKDARSPENPLTEDELLIMSFRVFGFVLRSRKWASLDLTYLSPITSLSRAESHEEAADAENKTEKQVDKSETAFEQLVLPPGHKEMVLSLIAQHFRDKESVTADTEQVDIVRGKGKGLIILLHGAPGVGKTTTAEGVAELFKKPLFQITCGDLGSTASEVELALETNFALANRWGCILLLDEADVFLTARSPQDFVRNGLVAVFLRVLEYYAGILFLTTNRIGDFDEAFASRVHISLHYPQLDLNSTREIFRLNLKLIRNRFEKKGRDIKIDEDEILRFAEDYWTDNERMRWNGRQIRNGCQTALALAEFDAQGGSHERIKDAHAEVKLQTEHLRTVSRAYLEFISYLTKLYGKDADRRAKAIGIRAREADGKKEDVVDPKEATPLKRAHTHAPVSSSVGMAVSAPPDPSASTKPAHAPPAPAPSVAPTHYPYPVYYPQQYAQMAQRAQPDAAAYAAQAQDRQVNMSPPSPAQWQSLNAGPWPVAQHPPGQMQFAGYPPGMQPPGFAQPPPGADQQQQMGGAQMPPTTRS